MCAPFWWSIQLGDEPATILNNGTICYVDTGTRELGVTADHVFNKYLEHIGQHGTDAVRCQLGGPSISPEKHLIDRNQRWELATFEIPEVLVTAAFRTPRSQHNPEQWPPSRASRQSHCDSTAAPRCEVRQIDPAPHHTPDLTDPRKFLHAKRMSQLRKSSQTARQSHQGVAPALATPTRTRARAFHSNLMARSRFGEDFAAGFR